LSYFGIVATFCEDIRAEASGQETLVGVFADNLAVPSVPIRLPKLAIFVRCNFSLDFKLKSLANTFHEPDGSQILELPVEAELIAKAIEESKRDGSPIFGIKTSAIFNPFPVKLLGRYTFLSHVNGEKYVTGTLNFQVQPSSTASPQQP